MYISKKYRYYLVYCQKKTSGSGVPREWENQDGHEVNVNPNSYFQKEYVSGGMDTIHSYIDA